MSITTNTAVVDTGYNGIVHSLAGIPSSPGHGLAIVTTQVVNEVTPPLPVLTNNPRRMYAFIQNTGAAALTVSVGLPFFAILSLQPWDIYVIDRDHPWTGAVAVTSADMNCYVTEASIQGT
jgi:hypothetical protein